MHSAELEHRFAHHPPASPERVKAHEDWRQVVTTSARMANTMLPEGREKSLALTHLQEAMMWGNAAIACDLTQQEYGR